MKKTIALNPGDPVTCMRRYYNGVSYHGRVRVVDSSAIEILFGANDERSYEPHGGYTSDEPCSLIPGHITPEPLTLPETVDFEAGDRVLAWNNVKIPGLYLRKDGERHIVITGSGMAYHFANVEPFSEDALFSEIKNPFAEPKATPAQPQPEPDKPKEGDWCLFWDNGQSYRVLKYRKKTDSETHPHVSATNTSWRNARKLKPADLSPELWEIVKGDKTDTQ